MKNSLLLLCLAGSMFLTSCAALGGGSVVTGAQATPVQRQSTSTPSSTVGTSRSTAQAPAGHDAATAQGAATDKSKRDKSKSKTRTTPVKDDNIVPVDNILVGEWVIVKVDTTSILLDEDQPYINFDKSARRFYASDGCNIVNGSYAVADVNKVSFADVLSTMKYCPVGFDMQIRTVLTDGMSVRAVVQQVGNETFVRFDGTARQGLLTLKRHNMEFLNGRWFVAAINGKKIDSDDMDIFIDIAELSIHGNSGCNHFNGLIYIDPSKGDAIDFNNIGLTRMMCPDMSRETAMMVALESTATALRHGDNEAVMLDTHGNEVLKLRRPAE